MVICRLWQQLRLKGHWLIMRRVAHSTAEPFHSYFDAAVGCPFILVCTLMSCQYWPLLTLFDLPFHSICLAHELPFNSQGHFIYEIVYVAFVCPFILRVIVITSVQCSLPFYFMSLRQLLTTSTRLLLLTATTTADQYYFLLLLPLIASTTNY